MPDRKTERRIARALRSLARQAPPSTELAERRFPTPAEVQVAEPVEQIPSSSWRSAGSSIVRALTVPAGRGDLETRDSATMAAQAKALSRGFGVGLGGGLAEVGVDGKSAKRDKDFLEAMADRAWVYSCVTRKAKSMKSGKLVVEPDTNDPDVEPLQTHPLLDLFAKPNPQTSRGLFQEQMLMDLELTGNFYAEVVYGVGNSGVPLELYRIRPDKMKILVDTSTGNVSGYIYTPDAGLSGGGVVHLEPWQVWHRRYANPLDDYRGLSPLSAARDSVVFEYQAKAQGIAFFANGLRMSGMISGEQGAGPDELALMRRIVEGRHKGASQSHKVMVLPGQWEYTDMSATPKDADWIEGLQMTRREVCAIFRVSPPLAGDFSEGTTFSNLAEARDEFWQGTMTEHFDSLDEDINHSLMPRFGSAGLRVRARHDLSDTPAMIDERDQDFKRATDAFNGGLVTLNEGRAEAKLEPLDFGDVRRIGLAIQEIASDEDSTLTDEPPAKPGDGGDGGDGEDGSGDGNGGNPAKPDPGDPQSGAGGQGKAADPAARHTHASSMLEASPAAWARLRTESTAHIIVKGRNELIKLFRSIRDGIAADIVKRVSHAAMLELDTRAEGIDPLMAGFHPSEVIGAVHEWEWHKSQQQLASIASGIHRVASKPAWDNSTDAGLGVTYNLNDPNLVATLDKLNEQYNGNDVFFENMRDQLVDKVSEGLDIGASIKQIIEGGTITPVSGSREGEGPIHYDGLRGFFKPWADPKNAWKAERFARTETGLAYNQSSLDSYTAAGMTQVDVYDGLYDPPCAEANGQVWNIGYASANPLEHPNCVRAFGPHVD